MQDFVISAYLNTQPEPISRSIAPRATEVRLLRGLGSVCLDKRLPDFVKSSNLRVAGELQEFLASGQGAFYR
jgi:hypothetical protein